jgi:hypothetical protein
MLRCFKCIISEPEIKGFIKSFIFHVWHPVVFGNEFPFKKCQDSLLQAQKHLSILIDIQELQ